MTADRRRFTRIGFSATARLTTSLASIEVQLHDLSFSGAQIQLPISGALARGTLCALSVPLADGASRISMLVEVVQVDRNKAGLQCRGIDFESVAHLRRLIELNLGDPDVLQVELHASSR